MTSAYQLKHELVANIEVLLLLVFMVASIYFMKQLLAFLSAFLDALTVIAVVISVATGFYAIYHKVSSGKESGHGHDHTDDEEVAERNCQDLDDFRAFQEALSFTALLAVFFSVVAVIIDQQLFKPVIQLVLAAKPEN